MQKQTNTSIPYYVSCLISGLTCHMNQHDLGASLKSPALLVQTGLANLQPPTTHTLLEQSHMRKRATSSNV